MGLQGASSEGPTCPSSPSSPSEPSQPKYTHARVPGTRTHTLVLRAAQLLVWRRCVWWMLAQPGLGRPPVSPPPTSPCTRRGRAPPGPAPGAVESGGHSRHALSPDACPSRRRAWQHPGDPSRGRGSRGRPPRHLLHHCPEPTLPSPRSLSKNPFSKPRPHTHLQSRSTVESAVDSLPRVNSLISAKLHPFCFISINRE